VSSGCIPADGERAEAQFELLPDITSTRDRLDLLWLTVK